jgi:CrcB protein
VDLVDVVADLGFVYVCLGAAVGAPARYLTDRAVQSRHGSGMPWGTLAVNVAGSLVLGLLIGLEAGHPVPAAVRLGVGTGFCGALTTFSTFQVETIRLERDGHGLLAVSYAAASMASGMAVVVAATVASRRRRYG